MSDSESDFSTDSTISFDLARILTKESRTPLGHDTTEDEQDPSSDEDDLVVDNDPLYQSRAAMFDDASENGSEGSDEDASALPPAFSEHPALRNAYVHAFVNAAYRGGTHESVKSSLTSTHSTIRTMLAGAPPPDNLDLHNMACTLRTVEKHLGVNPNRLLTYYFLCPECWKVYHPKYLRELQTPSCTKDFCSGILYTSKRTASQTEKRTPCKVMPSASLIKALEHFFMRPGKWEEVQAWRKDGDHEPAPTISCDEWLASLDWDKPLNDMSDGWVWRSIPAGFQRFWDPDRKTVDDVDVHRLYQRHVSLGCGLILQINLDW